MERQHRWTRTAFVALVAASSLVGMQRAVIPALADEEMADADQAVFAGTITMSPAMQLTPGGGAFTLSSTVAGVGNVCAIASAGAPPDATDPDPTVAGVLDAEAGTTCSVSASGTFGTLACGTGAFAGSGTLTESSSSDTYSITTFVITVVAGVGVLTGTAVESESDGNSTLGAGSVVGVVDMVPIPPVQTPPACASQLLFTAAVTTTA